MLHVDHQPIEPGPGTDLDGDRIDHGHEDSVLNLARRQPLLEDVDRELHHLNAHVMRPSGP